MKFKNIFMFAIMLLSLIAFASADTEITSCGQVVNVSDRYYLTGDLDCTSYASDFGVNLRITADDVEIDCQDYEIQGNPTEQSYRGIYMQNQNNLSVHHCDFNGGADAIKLYNAGDVDLYNNTYRDLTVIGSSINGHALFVEGDPTGVIQFRNSTVHDTDIAIMINALAVTNADLFIKHNNFYNNQAEVITLNFVESINLYSNYYDAEGACVDRAEDGTCDLPYGTSFFIDANPQQCWFAWDGGTTACRWSKTQYTTSDVEIIVIDGIAKIMLTILLFATLIVLGYFALLFSGKIKSK